MTQSFVVKSVILAAGVVAMGIGLALLFVPVAFYAGYGVQLAGNVSLLSDLRGSGGGLLFAGLFIAAGAFVPSLTRAALILSSGIYLSYGVSRFYGMLVDGLPVSALVWVAALEITIGLACFVTLVRAPATAQRRA